MRALVQRSLLLAIFMAAYPVLAGAALAAEPPVNDCDRLAANPRDTQRADVPGLLFEDIDGDAAVAACATAVDSYPEVSRFLYQLARAHDARGDRDAAIPLYEQAAKSGHGYAVPVLFWSYSEKFERSGGTDKDSRQQAVKWLRYGANIQQNIEMRLELGAELLSGQLLPPDLDAAIQVFRDALPDSGHLDSGYQQAIGQTILHIAGYDQERINLAFDWLEMASVNGSPDATDFLLPVYRYVALFGTIPKLTEEEAEYYLSEGSEPIHTYGRTPEHMIEYFKGAAEADHDWANFMLGVYYELGEHVPQDLENAKMYLERAVELGHGMASFQLKQLQKTIDEQ